MTHVLKQKKGVTLVELLAVIVILGIIAAIAVPTISGLIERQQTKADTATFVNVLEAARLYSTENPDEASFTITEIIGAGYLSANPFSEPVAADIIFTRSDSGIVSISESIVLKIGDRTVVRPAS